MLPSAHHRTCQVHPVHNQGLQRSSEQPYLWLSALDLIQLPAVTCGAGLQLH